MIIFDKTERGRTEIATRGQTVAPRLRTLLLLVDGKTGNDELLRKVAGLGLNQEHLDELLQAGLIQASADTGSGSGSANTATASSPVANNVATAEAPASKNIPPPAVSLMSAEQILPPGQTQFEAIYHFYNDTIKSMIGLRGYGLQLKVERAGSVQDFRELRQVYLEAVLKAKGEEIARSLRGRLDQLLYLGERQQP
ncbi:hypothetical protein SAMN04515618_112107 [Collimonas sp. OK307]|uniref:hypothetical protein n=1 Tax=Collimonas sp. OK307 TaxID=1801620 RepID=UPI0008ED9931|nr:hypothetical protein [Collimonas sp. OK307]SFI17555.1 hypothetical protein SAMN04515618_112107 [Collimonas sp. OK307]